MEKVSHRIFLSMCNVGVSRFAYISGLLWFFLCSGEQDVIQDEPIAR